MLDNRWIKVVTEQIRIGMDPSLSVQETKDLLDHLELLTTAVRDYLRALDHWEASRDGVDMYQAMMKRDELRQVMGEAQ